MTSTNITNSNNEKILLIVNKSKYADSLVESLSKLGYKTTQANTGEEGIKMIFDLLPHLVIVDIDLPDMDGYTVLEKKNSEKMLASIPVFLMSPNGEPVNMRRVPQNSVVEFIMSLHNDVDQVLQKVNYYFNKSHKKNMPSTAKKVLWIEDDKLISTILSKKLIAAGFELTHLKSGDEALTVLSENPNFDAILTDLILPGMSGFDILQKVKNTENLKHIPVMVLSNLSKPGDIERAKIMGAKKFLVKAAASLDRIVEETMELCE